MKRVRSILAAVAVFSSLWVVAPSPASACDKNPCQPVCHINPPAVHENGTVTIDDLIECYY